MVRARTDARDMIKISPLKYIVFNNPQGSYDFLHGKGVNVGNNVLSTYNSAKAYASQGGEAAILEMVRNIDTPYKQMIMKAHSKDSGFDGGEQKVETPAPVPTPTTPVSSTFMNADGTFKVSTQTIIIALVIVVFFLLVIRK